MKKYYIGTVSIVVNDAPHKFVSYVHRIVKNWEIDGSQEITGVSLSSVSVDKEKAMFCCSSSYFDRPGQSFVMCVFADGRKTKKFI